MGNVDTGKEEDTSEEDIKNAEEFSLLHKFPRTPFEPLFAFDIAEIEVSSSYLVLNFDVLSPRPTPQKGSLGSVAPLTIHSHEYI